MTFERAHSIELELQTRGKDRTEERTGDRERTGKGEAAKKPEGSQV